ncbi:DVU0298 family protein [Desulfobulbus sp.]|uniref:DVU0298 family protein n=1 Tax=Desulfobulbus sp. TaxID=895 RepID=UPI00286EC934|nr:DVU0298 family protein [Desulfobulbus sp.]
MSSRKIKHEVAALLQGRDLAAIMEAMRRYPAKEAVNALFALICRDEQQLRWHAVSCMGEAVARLAETDMEAARIVMRRFLWSLNDESGGIGWGAPEAMADAMCRHAGLAEEYVHMLISYMREDGPEICQDGNYIEHPLLQRGLFWGVARLSGCRPRLLLDKGAGEHIPPYLGAEDAIVRGLAAQAAGLLRLTASGAVLRTLAHDPAPLTLYRDGRFDATTVGALAQAALESMPS